MKIKKLIYNRILIVGVLLLLQIVWAGIFLVHLTSESWWIQIIFRILSIIALLVVMNRSVNPAYKLAWTVLILVFPMFGGLMYLLLGDKKPARRMRTKMESVAKQVEPLLSQEELILSEIDLLDKKAARQIGYILNSAKYPVYNQTQTKYYVRGEDNFPDMLEALRNAKHYIFMEYFIIGEGKMWNEILEILKEKAQQGLDVRLLYDDFGCLTLLPYQYEKELEKYNIKCEVFNPFVPIVSIVMNHRDHRKILVVDGYVGFTGGINLADEYINEVDRFGYWKDTGIRLIGEGVWSLTLMFLSMWNSLRKTDDDFEKFRPNVYAPMAFENDGYVQPYGDSPLDAETVGENVYLNIISSALEYVYMFTPYLIIDNEMMTALCLASKRGVDVRIMTPNVPDKKMVFMVTQSYYHQLVEAGVKIYQFEPGFLHAKCFVCDDSIATVGTINMDYRSLYLHFECGVFLFKSSSVFKIKQDFLETQEQCIPMTIDQLDRKLPFRLLQAVLRLFAPLM